MKCIESPLWFLLRISHNLFPCFRPSEWSLPCASTLTHIKYHVNTFSPVPPAHLYLSLMICFDWKHLILCPRQTFLWSVTCNGDAPSLKRPAHEHLTGSLRIAVHLMSAIRAWKWTPFNGYTQHQRPTLAPLSWNGLLWLLSVWLSSQFVTVLIHAFHLKEVSCCAGDEIWQKFNHAASGLLHKNRCTWAGEPFCCRGFLWLCICFSSSE